MPGKHQIRAVGVNKLNLSTRHLRHPFALKQCGFISNRKLETAFGQVLGRIKNSFHPSIGTDISDILRCIFGSLGYSFNSFNQTSQYWYGLGGSQRGKNGQSGPNSSGRRKDVVHAPKRQTQLQLAKSSNFRGLYYKPWGVRNYWKTWKNVRVHDDLSEFKRCHSTSLQSGFYNSWRNGSYNDFRWWCRLDYRVILWHSIIYLLYSSTFYSPGWYCVHDIPHSLGFCLTSILLVGSNFSFRTKYMSNDFESLFVWHSSQLSTYHNCMVPYLHQRPFYHGIGCRSISLTSIISWAKVWWLSPFISRWASFGQCLGNQSCASVNLCHFRFFVVVDDVVVVGCWLLVVVALVDDCCWLCFLSFLFLLLLLLVMVLVVVMVKFHGLSKLRCDFLPFLRLGMCKWAWEHA